MKFVCLPFIALKAYGLGHDNLDSTIPDFLDKPPTQSVHGAQALPQSYYCCKQVLYEFPETVSVTRHTVCVTKQFLLFVLGLSNIAI
jgi:hypothetical protein